MNMPIVHRLAARHAAAEGRLNGPYIASFHERMSAVFGGDYWQEMMWDTVVDRGSRERQLMDAYRNRLAKYLPYTGMCPVRETPGSPVKYFIVFASRHPDAMLLMNDAMADAYFGHMHQTSMQGTLFSEVGWKAMRSPEQLEPVIVATIQQNPGKSRKFIWSQIVQADFMRFTQSEFNSSLIKLATAGAIIYEKDPKTGRHNERSVLRLPSMA
jgi:hypothetical protein